MTKRVDILIMEVLDDAIFHVVNDKARHIDRVLCGGIRRRICKVKVLQLACGKSCKDRRRQNVNAFIHTVVADDLCAKELFRLFLIKHLHGHDRCAGIITCMRSRGKNDLFVVNAEFLCRFFANPRHSDGHIEDLDDR